MEMLLLLAKGAEVEILLTTTEDFKEFLAL